MQDLIIKITDRAELKATILAKLDQLCLAVFNQTLKDLTDTQVSDLLTLELNTSINSLTVFAQCTRQVQDYSPNVYSASQVIDLSNSYKVMIDQIKQIPDTKNKIERYVELKSAMYKLIAFKYSSTEEFLRNLLRESEIKDNVKAMGRFAK